MRKCLEAVRTAEIRVVVFQCWVSPPAWSGLDVNYLDKWLLSRLSPVFRLMSDCNKSSKSPVNMFPSSSQSSLAQHSWTGRNSDEPRRDAETHKRIHHGHLSPAACLPSPQLVIKLRSTGRHAVSDSGQLVRRHHGPEGLLSPLSTTRYLIFVSRLGALNQQ